MGRIVYTQMLNERGGIEADLTVTRLVGDGVPPRGAGRDAAARPCLAASAPRGAGGHHRRDARARRCCRVMGPKARELLALVSPDDFSNAAFPFGTAREVEIGMGFARAHRVTYVGELGWELYVRADQAAHVCETLVEAGEVGLKLCGLHAMDSAGSRRPTAISATTSPMRTMCSRPASASR